MYEDMTMDVIMEEMMEEMPDGLDTSEGSLIYHSCAKHGARLEEVYTELSALVDNQYSDTADLDHLVRFGQEKRCVHRKKQHQHNLKVYLMQLYRLERNSAEMITTTL